MNIEKRTRSVREGRTLRDGKGRFVSDATHSKGIVFGGKPKPVKSLRLVK